jgi:tol-pal system protein YbgF
MARSLALIGLLAAAVALSGCLATRGSVREVSARVDALSKDVTDLRRVHDASTRESASLVMELRTLSARFRDTEARIREASDRITTLTNRLAAAEASMRELASMVEALPRAPVTRGAPERPVERGASLGAEQAFAAALRTFNAGELGQAVIELTDFVNRHPKHPLVGRAQLWIGEAYFRQKDYRQALVEYRKAVESTDDPSTAADGWLKIGQTHGMLRERPAATQAWQRIVRDYPGTDAAGRARMLLRSY